MLENIVSPSPAVWTGLICAAIAIPVLIHLINLMRHRKVQWAAMDFLMKSFKKNRNRVWLRQFFLLVSRIATLLLALFLISQISCNNDRIARLLGSAATHHYVLLDDSFSMSERVPKGTLFDRARSTLSQIGMRARNRQNQRFTLLRFSQACALNGREPLAGGGIADEALAQFADLNGRIVDSQFDQVLEDTKSRLTVSHLSVDQNDAIETVAQLIQQRTGENAIVYILSDFRHKDWQLATKTEKLLSRIQESDAAIELINCVNMPRGNLAITDLEPEGNLRTAGVPVMMKLTVKNFSQSAAEKIQVRIQQLTFDSAANDQSHPADLQPKVDDLPTVFIHRIEPGESETRRFPVLFNATGQHVTMAQLPDDPINVDNTRYNVTQFESLTRVLMIDDSQQMHSGFLSLALNPGLMTGIESTIRPQEYLRDAAPEQLQLFDVIYLLDVERFDAAAIKNLERYAQNGGGVAFFLGPKTNLSFYNAELYREGKGIFLMPLEKAVDVPETIEQRVPDITPNQHPIFKPILGVKNSLLDLVQIKRIIQPPLQWQLSKDQTTVAATIRGIQSWPLILHRRFGNGQTIVVTTTAGPVWNNWSRNGTYPPIMLLMENELAAGRYPSESRTVGDPIQLQIDARRFTPNLVLISPARSQPDQSRLSTEYSMTRDPDHEDQLSFRLAAAESPIDQPGFYDAWFKTTTAKNEPIRFALSPDCAESDLTMASRQTMVSGLGEAQVVLVAWDGFNPEPERSSSSRLTFIFLVLLIVLLFAEQTLAYWASYHFKPGSGEYRPGNRVNVA